MSNGGGDSSAVLGRFRQSLNHLLNVRSPKCSRFQKSDEFVVYHFCSVAAGVGTPRVEASVIGIVLGSSTRQAAGQIVLALGTTREHSERKLRTHFCMRLSVRRAPS